jgi:hypothetical protein
MRAFLITTVKRGLMAAGLLMSIAFVGMLLLRVVLRAIDFEPAPISTALAIAAAFGAIGFGLVVVFELIGAGWRGVFGRNRPKPAESPKVEAGNAENGGSN